MTLQNLFTNMKSGEPYYTMVVYDPELKQCYNEFGDYDKDCVAYEWTITSTVLWTLNRSILKF